VNYGANTPLVLATDVLALLPGGGSDSAITLIIAGVSDLARKYCDRPDFVATSFNEQYRGTNNNRLFVKAVPIKFVGKLVIGSADGNYLIPGVPVDVNGFPFPSGQGYWFDENSIYLGSNSYPGGSGFMTSPTRFPDSSVSNVFVQYIAGYVSFPSTTTGASFVVPAVGVATPNLLVGNSIGLTGTFFVQGAGLFTSAIIDGTHITLTNLGGANAAVGATIASGVSISSTAPATSLPADLYEALCFECATRHKELTRLGIKSAAIGGETTSYSVTSLQPQTKDVLGRYRRVTGS
jgi:hypothetical protein